MLSNNTPQNCIIKSASPLLLLVISITMILPTYSSPVDMSSGSNNVGVVSNGGIDPLTQFHNLIREAIKYMHSINRDSSVVGGGNVFSDGGTSMITGGGGGSGNPGQARITGQVNVRNPRSEIALKLYHLQEMDRKYGAKARPRFGKRNEVTQDNFIPMYGDEEIMSSSSSSSMHDHHHQQQQQQPMYEQNPGGELPLSVVLVR